MQLISSCNTLSHIAERLQLVRLPPFSTPLLLVYPWIVYLSRLTSGANTSHREAGKMSEEENGEGQCQLGKQEGGHKSTHASIGCTNFVRQPFLRETVARPWRQSNVKNEK